MTVLQATAKYANAISQPILEVCTPWEGAGSSSPLEPLEAHPVVRLHRHDIVRRPLAEPANVAARAEPRIVRPRRTCGRPHEEHRRARTILPPQHRVAVERSR